MKIENLNKNKNNQENIQNLNNGMENMATKTNEKFGLNLLNAKGMINPEALGGLSNKEIGFIENRIKYWSKADNPELRKVFADFYFLESVSEEELTNIMIEKWMEEKETSKSAMLEMLVTIIFRKALGEDYLVMRSADIDDYSHGVDNIIINIKTNEIICAFDEVHDRKSGSRIAEKNDKIIKQAKKGGTSVDYAVKCVNGKLEKAKFSNVPNFYIALDIDELNEALEKVNCKNLDEISEFENNLFIKFSSAITNQAKMLLDEEGIPLTIKDRLEKAINFFESKK